MSYSLTFSIEIQEHIKLSLTYLCSLIIESKEELVQKSENGEHIV